MHEAGGGPLVLVPMPQLCHHRLVVDRKRSDAIRAGQRRAQRSGVRMGRPAGDVDPAVVRAMRTAGKSWQEIADTLGCSRSAARRAASRDT